jgi:hypothetical protein
MQDFADVCPVFKDVMNRASRKIRERRTEDHPFAVDPLDQAIEGQVFVGIEMEDAFDVGMRQGDCKYVFAEQRLAGTMGGWAEPFTKLRLQKIFNLMQDPFERAAFTSNTYWDWNLNHVGSAYGMMDDVFKFVATFKEFPPRSFPPSLVPATILDETLDSIKNARKGAAETQPTKK